MIAKTSRTLNPLPFQDLEPHRFEDLVRQLAYDLRNWKSLEATGRSGADDGLDIRAVEFVPIDAPDDDARDDGDDVDQSAATGARYVERPWAFQCKREKSLTPKRMRAVIAESLSSPTATPYGFVLAVACDVSKKSRDAFREEMVARGVEEFTLWAKGELEDMLFQPKNDRLLFAYFGISLTTRRRSLATEHRLLITRKKQLTALLGEERSFGKLVLLRDPSDARYPTARDGAPARWILVRAIHTRSPGHLTFRYRHHLAALTPDGTGWDALMDHNAETIHTQSELRALHAWAVETRERSRRQAADEFWNDYIPTPDRAFLRVFRELPFERVIAIDSLGDGYFPVPHILVDFDNPADPFADTEWLELEPYGENPPITLRPDPDNHTAIFPRPLPGVDDPAPAGFDDTLDRTLELSSGAAEKLSAIFGSVAIDDVHVDPGLPAGIAESSTELAAFRRWRETVGLPLFSAFVARLRALGHGARVKCRSGGSRAHGMDLTESVGLHVRLKISNRFNADYRPSGHLEITMSAYGGLDLNTQPFSRARTDRSDAPNLTLAELDQKRLELEVFAMLKRLSRGQ